MDLFNKQTSRKMGPGGWRCPCCGRKKRSKRQWRRYARRRIRMKDS